MRYLIRVRKFLLIFTISATLLPISAIAANTPVAGKSCPKVGTSQVYKNYKFTCRKSGTKKIWSVGIKVKQSPTPTVTASPSPTPTVTASPSPTPTVTASPSPTPTVTAIDPYRSTPTVNIIVEKISERISTLRMPDLEISDDSPILSEGTVPLDAVNSIMLQHKFMLQAFPDAFRWGNNKFYIFETIEWAKNKAIELNCVVPRQLSSPGDIPNTMWSITTHCGLGNNDKSSVSFLNWPSFQTYDRVESREVSGSDMWAFQAAQEGDGSTVQFFFYLGKDKYGVNNPLPAWFEQGGQFAISSIALAVQTRKWRQSSLSQGVVQTCNRKKVEDSSFYNANVNLGGCHYQLGGIATELMVALYGFDAPITWLKNIEIHPLSSQDVFLETWQSTFKKSYGDEISTFYRWANAYAEYLDSNGQNKLPEDLLLALKAR